MCVLMCAPRPFDYLVYNISFSDVGSGQYEPLYSGSHGGPGYPQQGHAQQAPYYGATGQ
jgi:hypothetical protein